MWGKERDYFQTAQAPKKETLFFISYLAYKKKKNHDWGEECWEKGGMWGKLLGTVQRSKLFWSGNETCLKGWAEAQKVSQRKFSTNKKKEKGKKFDKNRK